MKLPEIRRFKTPLPLYLIKFMTTYLIFCMAAVGFGFREVENDPED